MKYICFIIFITFVFSNKIILEPFNYTIYSDDYIDESFIFKQNEHDNCEICKTYWESKFSNYTNLTIQGDEFEPIGLSSSQMKAYYEYNGKNLLIYHTCDNIIDSTNKAEIIINESSNLNWSILKFNFKFANASSKIEFIKICKIESMIYYIPSTIIIFILAVLIVYLSSNSEMDLNIKEIEENREIKWWYGFVFIILGSIFLLIIFYFIKYISFTYTIIITCQSIISCYLLIDYYIQKKFENSFLQKRFFSISIIEFCQAITTIIIIYLWFISRNWILNNFIGYSLVFILISIFKIKNFKVSFYVLISIFIYDVFWVFYSSKIFKTNVMVVSATSLNVPIKLEIPLFLSNNPIRPCTFLGLGDLALPALIIRFCKYFDNIKNTKIYFILSMKLYMLSLLSAFFVLYCFNHAQPVMFYISPIFIIGIGYKAYIRSELYDIWIGKDFSGSKIAIEEMINTDITQIEEVEIKIK